MSATQTETPSLVPFVPPLSQGTIVTLARPHKEFTAETPFVVIADKSGNGRGRVNVALLGGTTDYSYLRVPRDGIVVRDLAWLKEVSR